MKPCHWMLLLGFALGGFFDGIVLHQLLQWHHFLSLTGGDLRFQIMADGLFHLFTYAVALLALWGLWRARAGVANAGGRRVAGALLAGFALWQLVDAAAAHWLLGLHRIRIDVANPLAWDLGWLALFGGLPALAAWLLLRRGGGEDGGRALRPASLAALAALTAALGWQALQPPPDAPFTAVLWRADATPAAQFAALAQADARLVWADQAAGAMLVAVTPENRWRLWRNGALMVGGAGLPAGCFKAARAAPPP